MVICKDPLHSKDMSSAVNTFLSGFWNAYNFHDLSNLYARLQLEHYDDTSNDNANASIVWTFCYLMHQVSIDDPIDNCIIIT
jgi:hypothetical protein